ncbi:MAG: V-type ATPase subunit, partial [Candidatus Nanohaloarchaea archaeon]
EIAEFMENRGYQGEVNELGADHEGEDLIERAVRSNVARTYRELMKMSPGPVQELLSLYFRKFDIQSVKTVLREKLGGGGEDVDVMVLPTRELDRDTLERFMEMEAEDILSEFHLKGFNGDVMDEVEDPSDLSEVEDALNIYYYTNLVEKAGEAGGQSRLFQRFLKLEAALKNISLILRLNRKDYTYEDIKEKLIPVPSSLQVVDEDMLARADEEEMLKMLRESELGEYLEEDLEIPQVETSMERYKLEQGVNMMHRDQLGVNPVLGYMVCKEAEARNLRMIARAKAEGLGEDFMERNLVGGVAG